MTGMYWFNSGLMGRGTETTRIRRDPWPQTFLFQTALFGLRSLPSPIGGTEMHRIESDDPPPMK